MSLRFDKYATHYYEDIKTHAEYHSFKDGDRIFVIETILNEADPEEVWRQANEWADGSL